MGVNEIIELGTRIKKLRIKKGYTAKNFAAELNIPYSIYSNYKNNNREPNLQAISKIASALGVSINELITNDEYVILGISEQMKNIADRTELYLRILKDHGYETTVNRDTVDITAKGKKSYSVNRVDFMAMIQRCYKDIEWNMEKFLEEHAGDVKNV